jgi:hypothetical protein
VRRLPVVDPDGRPVGMLSLTDLARAACGRHPLVHGLSMAGSRLIATARTWASICTPRTRLDEAVLSRHKEAEAPGEPVEPEVRWEWRSYGPMACGGPVGGRPAK